METTLTKVVRIVLGAGLLFFGLNKFFHFFTPPPHSEAAGVFLGGLASSGYFFPMLGIIEAGTGLALVLGLYVPLALLVLAPVSLNIVLFHLFLDPGGIMTGAVMGLMLAYLGWAYRESYAQLFKAR